MAKLANLARMTTATAGTGTITLGAAVSGFKTFAQAGITDGMRVSYAIKDGSNSELGEGVYTSSGTTLTRVVASSTNSDSAINLSGAAEVFITPSAASLLRIESPGGRLTLAATPVMTSTTSAQTTVYYAPYIHRFVPLYDGTSFEMHDVGAELSQATTDTTKSPAACTTNSNYDLFVWIDSGTYRCTRGPLWSSSTERGTGAGTTELERIAGILTNKVAITNGPAANRGTYVGTIRTNGSSQVDWIYGADGSPPTAGFFGVWNMYNRVLVVNQLGDTAGSWSYNSTTIREANARTTYQVSFVSGWQDDAFEAQYIDGMSNSTAGGYGINGIGYDSTTAFSGYQGMGPSTAGSTSTSAAFHATSALGFHYFAACEKCVTAATQTFFGSGIATGVQTGMQFKGWM